MKSKLAPKKYIVPCPKCGAGYPIVAAIWDIDELGNRTLVCCCTHCGIQGTIKKRCPIVCGQNQCVMPAGHKGRHRALSETGETLWFAEQ